MVFKARKTTTYKNVYINSSLVITNIDSNKTGEEIILKKDAQNKSDSFWRQNRHERLNTDEQVIYKVLDTLEKNKTYVFYRNSLRFLTTGTKDIGHIRIGPWYNWVSVNRYEGLRLRFDLATNKYFDNHLNLSGYLAYGFKSRDW